MLSPLCTKLAHDHAVFMLQVMDESNLKIALHWSQNWISTKLSVFFIPLICQCSISQIQGASFQVANHPPPPPPMSLLSNLQCSRCLVPHLPPRHFLNSASYSQRLCPGCGYPGKGQIKPHKSEFLSKPALIQ